MHVSSPRALNENGATAALRRPLPLDRVFVRNLELSMSIGVHAHERLHRQMVIINIDIDCERSVGQDGIRSVVCYERLTDQVKALAEDGHIELVETLADRIAGLCLADRRVHRATVRVEKPGAIVGAASVGVEIERHRSVDGF